MAVEKLQDHFAYPPRTFRAERAAAYLSMSTSCFLKLVDEAVMPKPVKIKGMTMWDRHDLDGALENLKEQKDAWRSNLIEERNRSIQNNRSYAGRCAIDAR